MKKRALLSALALCFLAAGCPQKGTEPPKPKDTAAVVPLPPAAPTAPAASANQDAKPAGAASSQPAQVAQTTQKAVAKTNACKGGQHCSVEVTVTDGAGSSCTIVKSPDPLYVAKGNPEKITWKMAPGSTWALDKIVFNAGAPFKCRANGPHITCDDANTETAPKQHPYWVHVKKGTAKCSNDPMIVNGAEDQN